MAMCILDRLILDRFMPDQAMLAQVTLARAMLARVILGQVIPDQAILARVILATLSIPISLSIRLPRSNRVIKLTLGPHLPGHPLYRLSQTFSPIPDIGNKGSLFCTGKRGGLVS